MKDNETDRMWNMSPEEFDLRYRYDGKDLGAVCREDKTVFKLWSPFAEQVTLRLYREGESGTAVEREMKREDRGVWKLEFPENLHGRYYDFLVRNQGKTVRTGDPYARGCSCNGRRSMAVDPGRTDPPGFREEQVPRAEAEQIIYELHIKDFSYDRESGIPREYRGKYKAFTVKGDDGLPVCIRHLTELGITHVQLMPFFDYASVDEAGEDTQYNWGYDPLNYNVPEGSYATDPHDGTVRIRECKEMIQALHRYGIRVIMDVVYNHTFSGDSWLERTVPGYYYRRREDGSPANGSACGNDIAAGRSMVDNYIVDSVMYWVREYHVDGFRFDLMGLLTVDLMNRIRRELDREFGEGRILLYGEPWRAEDSPMETGQIPALKANTGLLEDGVGIFSDDTRDVIKGHVFQEEVPGFVNGGTGLESRILHAVTGWRDGGADFAPRSCRQIVNYVSVHDNFTLWDKLVLTMHRELRQYCRTGNFVFRHEDVLEANKLAAFIYFTCQGNLLMQAGEEFGRTKLGEHNSYRSAPEVNMLRWRQIYEFADLVDYYRGLISLRKKLPGLCDKSPGACRRICRREIHGEGAVSFWVDNSGADQGRSGQGEKRGPKEGGIPEAGRESGMGTGEWGWLFVAYNASDEDRFFDLREGKSPGSGWEILADGRETDCRRTLSSEEAGRVCARAHSGLLAGRRAFE